MTYRICTAGRSAALAFAAGALRQAGCTVLPGPDDTATHLLLPVPSLELDGSIKGGGDLSELLDRMPKDITVLGGNLRHPALEGYRTVDLLQNPGYVAENANITAHCALRLAMQKLPVILEGQQVLVIGWGRIGKCLARLLRQLGVQVTVAARKETDRAMLRALGYPAADTAALDAAPYRVVFNTAPQMIIPKCTGGGLFIDLASSPGLGGSQVITARGLPGKDAPESSGSLIARTVLTILNKECSE